MRTPTLGRKKWLLTNFLFLEFLDKTSNSLAGVHNNYPYCLFPIISRTKLQYSYKYALIHWNRIKITWILRCLFFPTQFYINLFSEIQSVLKDYIKSNTSFLVLHQQSVDIVPYTIHRSRKNSQGFEYRFSNCYNFGWFYKCYKYLIIHFIELNWCWPTLWFSVAYSCI